MNKHEKKSYNTHTKICKTTLELIESDEYDNISVSAICNKAKISRSTFYAHFQNIAEIIDVINSGLMESFFSEYGVSCAKSFNPKLFAVDPYIILSRQDLLKFLTFIKSHARLFAIIAKHRNVLRLGLAENDLKRNVFIPIMSQHQHQNEVVLDYIFDFYVSGTQNILTKWILNGCSEKEEDIIRIIDLCMNKSTFS